MTITEKILAEHSKKKEVKPNELILAKVDIALGNDITAPIAISEFRKIGVKKVFNNTKVILVADHFTPAKDVKSAISCKILRDFAKEQKIKYYFEGGNVGIEHILLPEQGLVVPGDLIIGADSHTCTYGALGAFSTGVGSTDLAFSFATGEIWLKVPENIKFIYKGKLNKWVMGKDLILYTIGKIGVDGALYKAMEFSGEVISKLAIEDRFTMCNMAIEAGAKNGIIEPDKITENYIKKISKRKYEFYKSDKDAKYADIIEYDCSKIEPQVAFPHLPSNAKGVSEVKNIKIDQAFIGSCTNGSITDMRISTKILNGKKVHKWTRLIVIPGTPTILKQMIEEGIYKIFLDSGAVIGPPTCGPCLGGHMGVLGPGEVCISTTNRNFLGRMGSTESKVYLANPAIVAASAIAGRISSPEEI